MLATNSILAVMQQGMRARADRAVQLPGCSHLAVLFRERRHRLLWRDDLDFLQSSSQASLKLMQRWTTERAVESTSSGAAQAERTKRLAELELLEESWAVTETRLPMHFIALVVCCSRLCSSKPISTLFARARRILDQCCSCTIANKRIARSFDGDGCPILPTVE